MLKLIVLFVRLGPQLADIIERAETSWLNSTTMADKAHVVASALEEVTEALRSDLK